MGAKAWNLLSSCLYFSSLVFCNSPVWVVICSGFVVQLYLVSVGGGVGGKQRQEKGRASPEKVTRRTDTALVLWCDCVFVNSGLVSETKDHVKKKKEKNDKINVGVIK